MSDNKSFFNHSLVINKPASVVFKALTDAHELTHWFPSRAESDPRKGGKFMLAWDFTDAAQNGSQNGEYVEFEPNTKVSYTWMAESGPTLVSIQLSEADGETTLALDHASAQAGMDDKKLHEGHANQWMFFLMNLKGYLEAGMDMRKEKLNQVTH